MALSSPTGVYSRAVLPAGAGAGAGSAGGGTSIGAGSGAVGASIAGVSHGAAVTLGNIRAATVANTGKGNGSVEHCSTIWPSGVLEQSKPVERKTPVLSSGKVPPQVVDRQLVLYGFAGVPYGVLKNPNRVTEEIVTRRAPKTKTGFYVGNPC